MLKNIFLLITLFACTSLFAQLPQKPTGTPGKNQLPVPKIHPLTPADLQVTSISFESITFNATTKTYLIKVNVVIKNAGEVTAGRSHMRAFCKTPSGGGSWVRIGDAVIVNPLNGGASVTQSVSFKAPIAAAGAVPFDFRVNADADIEVAESDETNNFSSVIVINPHAH